MSEPFLAEVRIVGFNFAPRGWAFCDGQILPINQNQSLYALLGTTYGGDGRTTFALPDLRGRVPIHAGNSNGNSYTIGQKSGAENHTLSINEMPGHTHQITATDVAPTASTPTGHLLSRAPSPLYKGDSADATLNPATVADQGGGQAHNNMMPFVAVNFCIALQGLFPSRN